MPALSEQSHSPIEAKGNIRIIHTEPDTCASISLQGMRSPFLRPAISYQFDPIQECDIALAQRMWQRFHFSSPGTQYIRATGQNSQGR